MVPRSLKLDFGKEVADDLPHRIRALLMGCVRRARNLDIPRVRIELAEPAALLLTRRFVIVACHQQDRASDAGQHVVRQLGTRHAVLVQGRDQVAPVVGAMGGLMKASQRVWPGAV
jgi:hypothetical protein